MKTFTLKVNEDELKALIAHHSSKQNQACYDDGNKPDIETSARIHDLTKRLNRETPEIETDPRPMEDKSTETKTESW